MIGIHEFITLALWLISILATLFLLRDTGLFTYLAPVYLICMVGSIITVRNARRGKWISTQSQPLHGKN